MRAIGRIANALRVATVATMMVVTSVSPALAVDDNAPNLTLGGYGVNASASVICDPLTRSLTVTARASAMQGVSYSGGVTYGPYDNGQWLTYNVWAREVTAPNWTLLYDWSMWQFIDTFTDDPNRGVLITPVDLGVNVVNGAAGHNYQALVQISWYTNQMNVANVTPVYHQIYRADDFNTYPFNPTRCIF